MDNFIEIKKLTKKYGKKTVLNELDFSIDDNKLIVIVGKNGSGKSTLLKCLIGHVKKYSGEIENLNGREITGFVENASFYNALTGLENMKFFLNADELKQFDKYSSIFKMDDYINKKVGKYSSGMKQRLIIAYSFSKNSDLILLDEPTNSLDLDAVNSLKDILLETRKEKTIIVTTHDLSIVLDSIVDLTYKLVNGKLVEIEENFDEYIDYEIGFNTKEDLNEFTSKSRLQAYKSIKNRLYIKLNAETILNDIKYISQFNVVEIKRIDDINKFLE